MTDSPSQERDVRRVMDEIACLTEPRGPLEESIQPRASASIRSSVYTPHQILRRVSFSTGGIVSLLRERFGRQGVSTQLRSRALIALPGPSRASASAAISRTVPRSPHTIENYDPTYGLRPEGAPSKSTLNSLPSLFARNKGLVDLAEQTNEVEDTYDETRSSDPWEDFLSDGGNIGPSVTEVSDITGYDAVGGGTITRPRVCHSQSQIHVSPDSEVDDIPPPTHRPDPGPSTARPSSVALMRFPSRPDSLCTPYSAAPYSESPLRRTQSIPPVPSLDHSPC
ncbi:hypothetical protein C8Q74DRAFT_370980 [Fomes fomentarius]|nr:hypothetical protein C8Q74DRAFT_370980 [Fomes fomentarius]